jgi:hypothetical protein
MSAPEAHLKPRSFWLAPLQCTTCRKWQAYVKDGQDELCLCAWLLGALPPRHATGGWAEQEALEHSCDAMADYLLSSTYLEAWSNQPLYSSDKACISHMMTLVDAFL